MPDKILPAMTISVDVSNVDLTTVVGTRRVRDDDDGYYDGPMTLGEAVAREIAGELMKDESYPGLRQKVLSLREEEIREQLRPIVTGALEAPVQKTNSFGEPAGEPASLTSLIVKEAQSYLTRRADSYGTGQTIVQKFITEAVDRALKKELAEVVADEKAKVVAAVRAKAAELIATAVKEGVGR